MRNYATLGQGKSTKVLAVDDYNPARTVTTCSADAATGIARMLGKTDREIPAAMYPLAVALDGKPVEARRHLLGVYDTVIAGTRRPVRNDEWHRSEVLVTDLSATVADQPAPVIAAVRTELANHLAGLDGVLVPARANTPGYHRYYFDLVVSRALHDDHWWEYLLDGTGDLQVLDDDETIPVGGPLVGTMELNQLVHEFYDAEPTGPEWGFSMGMKNLMEEVRDDSSVELNIRVDHFLAFVAYHRPDDMPTVKAALTGPPSC
jgi:hypothetical protein